MSKGVHYVAMMVTMGILADLMMTTFQLARLDKGLHSSLHSTSQLVSIERQVNHKNAALGSVLKTTKQMDGQLTALEQTAAQTDRNIAQIGQLNAETLQWNTKQASISANSGQTLGAVLASMQSLQQATAALNQYVSGLDQVIKQDRANLDQLNADTHTMNQKTPGV